MNPATPHSKPFSLEDAIRAEEETIERQAAEYQAKRTAAQRAETNRQNARKSTGPRTEAGKAASSKNRLAHGLCSSSLIIYGECQEEFDDLQIQTHITFDPQTAEETLLVDQMTEALWRLNRARRVESKTFERMMDLHDSDLRRNGVTPTDQTTEGQISASLFDPNYQRAMATVQRYVAAAERTYRQSLKAVQEAIKRRPAPPLEQPVITKKDKAMAAGQSFSHESGFEPQIAMERPQSAPAFIDRC